MDICNLKRSNWLGARNYANHRHNPKKIKGIQNMKIILRRRAIVDEKLQASNLPPLLQRLYAARGVTSPDEVAYDLKNLAHFAALKNIDLGVDCLIAALTKQERILIIGDFDADGATSTALAVLALRAFGFHNVTYLIPNRFEFGYGLTPEIVAVAATMQPDLIITVDNGISSHAGVAAANQLGIKVLVTDHHLPPFELPDAVAIINPSQAEDIFPSKALAGVGVVFYLMLALRSRLRQIGWFQQRGILEPNLAQFLDLVALGTVADLVPLDYNNRILVQQGLERIRSGECRVGIKALLQIAKRDYEQITTSDLGYAVAPRLNAAGRLDDMSLGVECLLSDDAEHAAQMAKALNDLNDTRREIESDMQQQALLALASLSLQQNLPHGLCIFDPNWHIGVVGILASRIKERVHRPVIAFAALNDEEIKGSGRSVTGLHLRDVLSNIAASYPDLITKFGGHAMAVGLSLRRQNYEAFNAAFIAEVEKHLKEEDLQAKIYTDGELEPENICLTTAKILRKAGPWGQEFPDPVFEGDFNVLQQKLVGQKHLKMFLAIPGGSNMVCDAIRFNADLKHWPNERCKKVHIVYRLDVNEYNDNYYLQLIIEHLQEI